MSAVANTGHLGTLVVPGMTAEAPEGRLNVAPAGAISLGLIATDLCTVNLGGMSRLRWHLHLPEAGTLVAPGAEIRIRVVSQGVAYVLDRIPTLVGVYDYTDAYPPIVGETATLSIVPGAAQVAGAIVYGGLWASSV